MNPLCAVRRTPWVLLLLILLSPLLLLPGPWSIAALVVVGAAWVWHRAMSGRPGLSGEMRLAVGLMFCLALLGLGVSPDRARGLAALYRLVLGIAFMDVLARDLSSVGVVRGAVGALCAVGAALATAALFGTRWDIVRILPLSLYERIPRVMLDVMERELFNPRIVGMALATLLPVPLASGLYLSHRSARLLACMAALVIAVVLILSQSIQAALGVAAGLVILAVWERRWLVLAVSLALAALGGMWLWATGPQRVAQALLSVGHPLGIAVVLRLDMWSRALAMLRDMPYTGIGPDVFAAVQAHFYPGLLLGPEPHAHSLYLQLALDLGVPGLVCFGWLIGLIARKAVRTRRFRPEGEPLALLVGSLGGLAAFLASGAIDTLWTAKPAIFCWILMGTTVGCCDLLARQGSGERPVNRRPWRALLVPGALGLAVVLSLLMCPGQAAINRGLVLAHRGLIQARTGEEVPVETLRSAAQALEGGISRVPGSPPVWRTLGGAYAWLGDHPRAVVCLERAVVLDVEDPLGRYAPFEKWRRALQGGESRETWQDLLWVYQHWTTRYPQRAEGYVAMALVWSGYGGDPTRALATLRQGLDRGARPGELLAYYLGRLQEVE